MQTKPWPKDKREGVVMVMMGWDGMRWCDDGVMMV